MLDKCNKNYVHPTDVFLDELRQRLPESESQRQERLKHEKIAKLRDDPKSAKEDKKLWEKF